ncbi:MAG: 2-phospho-L-lactate guanylyltransferase [Actinobacteria bacterium]|nr:2-phospho-L-lactate guanylyltransferase [Actinomycetota bacterium]
MRPIIAVPLKPFAAAKGRLADALAPGRRAALMEESAARVLRAAATTAALPVVVTADPGVADWAHQRGIEVLAEPPGGGLDGAAAAAAGSAAAAGAVWCIVHGDLPLLEPAHLERVLAAADGGAAVLAPSRTGGTNVLGGTTPVEFRYGPGSYARHLAACAGVPRRVIVAAGTALDLDTPADLIAAAALPGGAWLLPYLDGAHVGWRP